MVGLKKTGNCGGMRLKWGIWGGKRRKQNSGSGS